MALQNEQQQVLNAILRIGRRRGASPMEIKAAIETGLVESGLRNLSGGDADSAGWRQERASLYTNPTNLNASINRFFDETAAVRGRYVRAGDLAAAVQRPATQYRGRYQGVEAQADQLRGGAGASARSSTLRPSSGGSTRTTTTTTPGVDNRAERAKLVLSFLQQKGADPVAFALRARELRDIAPTSDTQTQHIAGPRRSSSPSAPAPAGGHGSFSISGPNPGRLQPHLTSFAKQVANHLGMHLTGLDGSTHSKLTTNGNVSQHYTGNATDIFTINGKSLKQNQGLLLQAGRAALIAAGMPRAKAMRAPFGLYNVGGHQIIFGTNSRALGGDHTDHLHISAR